MPKKDITVIQLRTATRERLKEIGKKGESYDAIINRILDDRNISGARSSRDWSCEYPLPMHDEVSMNINSLYIDDIKFETAIECLGLQPDDIDGYEKMEELIETAEEKCAEYGEKLRERLITEIKNFCK